MHLTLHLTTPLSECFLITALTHVHDHYMQTDKREKDDDQAARVRLNQARRKSKMLRDTERKSSASKRKADEKLPNIPKKQKSPTHAVVTTALGEGGASTPKQCKSVLYVLATSNIDNT